MGAAACSTLSTVIVVGTFATRLSTTPNIRNISIFAGIIAFNCVATFIGNRIGAKVKKRRMFTLTIEKNKLSMIHNGNTRGCLND